MTEQTYRPRMVLGYADPAHASRTGRSFRRRGWEVHLVGTSSEARRLTALLAPDLVVLDTDLFEESGWLTCAKLRLEQPEQRIFLVSAEVGAEKERLCDFVGAAALFARTEDVAVLLPEASEARVPA
jgi:DNA-binding response OmpR family regulator